MVWIPQRHADAESERKLARGAFKVRRAVLVTALSLINPIGGFD